MNLIDSVNVDASPKNQPLELASRLKSPNGFFEKLRASSRLKNFISENGFTGFRCPKTTEQAPTPIHPSDKLAFYGVPNSLIARVKEAPFHMPLEIVDLHDSNDVPYGIKLHAIWKIANPSAFLRKYAKTKLECSQQIAATLVESDLVAFIQPSLMEVIAEVPYTFDELASKSPPLPQAWFEKRIKEYLTDKFSWLELVSIQAPQFVSEIGEMRADQEKRNRLIQAEIEATRFHLNHEAKANELRHSSELNELDRCKELVKAKHAAEIAQLKFEKEKAEIICSIEQTRNQEDVLAGMEKSFEDSHDCLAEQIKLLEKAVSDTQAVRSNAKQYVQTGIHVGEQVNLDHLNFASSNASTSSLEAMGINQPSVILGQVFREKQNRTPDRILVKKVEILTRDIGTKKVNTLAIGSTLSFEMMSKRAGYVSVLNLGTSGRIGLHCPNAYVSPAETRINANFRAHVPGDYLIPDSELARLDLPYIEGGPPGWEIMAIIVSDEPLFNEADLFSAQPLDPFPNIPVQRSLELLDQLVDLPESAWDVGLLSFLVPPI